MTTQTAPQRIAVTGGTGFVGRHLALALVDAGHDVVVVTRAGFTAPAAPEPALARLLAHPRISLAAVGLDDAAALTRAFTGCSGVAHVAGINREVGRQTYARVHVAGTAHVVAAAEEAGCERIALLSFLRARPDCGSRYHESKWAAEELVRHSGLKATILKAGVIYGHGDHLLDHLSRALYTFPVFALVGMRARDVRPVAVRDVVRVLMSAVLEDRLAGHSVAVLGPERMPLSEAVRRVAEATGQHRVMLPAPLAFHRMFAWLTERTMRVPLVALAQVRILSEGIVEPAPWADELPADLVPRTPFSQASIRAGLPAPGRFTRRDLACSAPLLCAPAGDVS